MKIELRRAAMTYQAPDGEVAALRDVTFGVADGEFVSIVGPSGCGKSTLLALIAGIEHPSGGEVLVDGEPVRAPTGKAGLMPQRDQLFDWRTIWGNVTLGLEVRHENTPARRDGVHDLLEQYQLAGFARKLPNQLSGGMRQRCALIRTLATSPDVLLLDGAVFRAGLSDAAGRLGRYFADHPPRAQDGPARHARYFRGHQPLGPHRRPVTPARDRQGHPRPRRAAHRSAA